MREAMALLLILAAPGAARGAEGTGVPVVVAPQGRADPVAKPLSLVDPDAPVPMEIRTSASPGNSDATPFGCVLVRDGWRQLTSQQCTGCHGGAFHSTGNHQVEVEYDAVRGKSRESVRPREEAVKRGAFLPEGKVRCISCHDGRSRLRYRLAIPTGAELRAAVKISSPATYEPGPQAAAAKSAPLATLEGFEAAVKPLCLECHAMD